MTFRRPWRFAISKLRTPESARASVYRDLPENAFREDLPKARLAVRLARGARDAACEHGAASLAMDAILAAPGWHGGYHMLADTLRSRGNARHAERCQSGLLPDEVLAPFIDSNPDADGPSTDYVRHTLRASERIALPRPRTVGGDTADAAFAAREIVTRGTHVDSIASGRLWHDANNTLVRDRDNRALADHTIGSELLIRKQSSGSRPHHLGRRAVLLGARGAGNYYHWLVDILPKLAVCRDAGIDIESVDRFVVPFRRGRFQPESLARAGVHPDQVYYTSEGTPDITADELIVPYLRNAMGLALEPTVPAFLRACLQDAAEDDTRGTRRLFVSRPAGRVQGRSLVDAKTVYACVRRLGFEIVYPERLSLCEQAGLFASASIVAGIHGAGLTNIVHCRPGTAVVELYGAHVAPCFWAIAAVNQLRYFQHRCETPGSDDRATALPAARRSADIRISSDALRQILELALESD